MSDYSFSTAALFPLETEEALVLIKQAGFAYAEMMPQAYSDVTEKSTLKFEKTGMPVASVHFPLVMFGFLYTPHRTMMQDGRDFSRALIKMGSRLGAKILVTHPHKPDVPGYRDILEEPILENLRWLAGQCQNAGIVMAMENSAKTCATVEQLTGYIDILGHENIKPMVDIDHVHEAGGDPVDFLRRVCPCHLHLSDFKQEITHLPLGEGEADWPGIRGALEGYSGFYTVEPSKKYYLKDTAVKLRKDYEFIRSVFEGSE